MQITVKQATKADKINLWNFVKSSEYGVLEEYMIGNHWHWEFTENPYYNGEKLPIWIAQTDENIIGQTCAMYVPLKIGNQIHNAAWSVDTIVLNKYRGKGIGNKLQRASADYHNIFMSLGMSEANRRIKEKFGSVPIDPMVSYILPIKFTGEYLYRYFMKRTRTHLKLQQWIKLWCNVFHVHKMLAVLLNIIIYFSKILRNSKSLNGNIVISKIDKFGSEIDKLWDNTHYEFDAIVKRDKKYLNWKFVEQPNYKYDLFVAQYKNAIKGYMIIRKCKPPELRIGVIVDLFASRNDMEIVEALINYAIEFCSNDMCLLEYATTIPEYKNVILKKGFKKRTQYIPMFYCKESTPNKELALKKGSWFLTKGDHDIDRYSPVYF